MFEDLPITRDGHTAAALRRDAARCRDSDAARRMLALALIKDGRSHAEAAQSCGMDRQTFRDWVHRYNDAGLAGLSDKKGRTGPKPRLTPEQEAKIAAIVRNGPGPEDGVVRWRRIDLAGLIKAHFGVALAERTVEAFSTGTGRSRPVQPDTAAKPGLPTTTRGGRSCASTLRRPTASRAH